MNGIDRLDYFAAHCPDSWLDRVLPRTIGNIMDTLIKEGIIPASRKGSYSSVTHEYSESEYQQLLVRMRYKYAMLMVAERDRLDKFLGDAH